MKVLMMTQAVDPQDGLLGFVPLWLRALALRVEKLYVLAGRVVPCDLPANVEVCSLGKEKGTRRFGRLVRFYTGLREAVARHKVDVIFAHMNPEYVIAAAPVTRVPCVLWYSHHTLTRRLRIAVRLSRLVVASAPEFFPMKTPKLRITGQGVDLERFTTAPPRNGFRLFSVGRLAPVKNHDVIIEACAIMKKRFPDLHLTLAGEGPRREALERLAKERGVAMTLLGSVPFPEIPRLCHESDLFVSASETALDKAILEAMAAGRPAVACAPAFAAWAPDLSYKQGDAAGLAEVATRILFGNREAAGRDARDRIERDHSLPAMVNRLVKVFEEACGR
ncbi:MAG: glycosyltransferase [Planctomycetota bacterium]|mgnify:CR=1 FL=1